MARAMARAMNGIRRAPRLGGGALVWAGTPCGIGTCPGARPSQSPGQGLRVEGPAGGDTGPVGLPGGQGGGGHPSPGAVQCCVLRCECPFPSLRPLHKAGTGQQAVTTFRSVCGGGGVWGPGKPDPGPRRKNFSSGTQTVFCAKPLGTYGKPIVLIMLRHTHFHFESH